MINYPSRCVISSTTHHPLVGVLILRDTGLVYCFDYVMKVMPEIGVEPEIGIL